MKSETLVYYCLKKSLKFSVSSLWFMVIQLSFSCHTIVIHSHTIVRLCAEAGEQLCDHCIYYCVTIVIIVLCFWFRVFSLWLLKPSNPKLQTIFIYLFQSISVLFISMFSFIVLFRDKILKVNF